MRNETASLLGCSSVTSARDTSGYHRVATVVMRSPFAWARALIGPVFQRQFYLILGPGKQCIFNYNVYSFSCQLCNRFIDILLFSCYSSIRIIIILWYIVTETNVIHIKFWVDPSGALESHSSWPAGQGTSWGQPWQPFRDCLHEAVVWWHNGVQWDHVHVSPDQHSGDNSHWGQTQVAQCILGHGQHRWHGHRSFHGTYGSLKEHRPKHTHAELKYDNQQWTLAHIGQIEERIENLLCPKCFTHNVAVTIMGNWHFPVKYHFSVERVTRGLP